MINLTKQEQRRRLAQAYYTLRRTIYWGKKTASGEWSRDNCRYPLRNYYKHGTLEDIKAAWFLRYCLRATAKPTYIRKPYLPHHDL